MKKKFPHNKEGIYENDTNIVKIQEITNNKKIFKLYYLLGEFIGKHTISVKSLIFFSRPKSWLGH